MRDAAKQLTFLLALIGTAPLIALTWIEEKLLGRSSEFVYGSCKELLALIPSPIGNYLRRAYYWASCRSVASTVSINFGAIIAHRDTRIAEGTVVGSFSIVGSATIGRNVLIASGVSILSGKYQHGRPADRATHGKAATMYEVVTIGENALLGQNAIILANVGRDCTVGAGSVVNRAVPDGVTVMGNPARRVSLEPAAAIDSSDDQRKSEKDGA